MSTSGKFALNPCGVFLFGLSALFLSINVCTFHASSITFVRFDLCLTTKCDSRQPPYAGPFLVREGEQYDLKKGCSGLRLLSLLYQHLLTPPTVAELEDWWVIGDVLTCASIWLKWRWFAQRRSHSLVRAHLTPVAWNISTGSDGRHALPGAEFFSTHMQISIYILPSPGVDYEPT